MNKNEILYAKAAEYGITSRFEQLLSVQGKEFVTQDLAARQTGISYLMGKNSSSKAAKNLKYNYTSGVLYLAPSLNSGINICPKATQGCSKACLYFTGRNSMKTGNEIISRNNAVQFLKTALFFINRPYFMDWLDSEISSLDRTKGDNKPCVRLNGTSDINVTTFRNSKGDLLLEKYSHIQFYDYTKVLAYFDNLEKFSNYDLTFSFGGSENMQDTLIALEKGYRVSVPFVKENFGNHFPDRFWDRPVVDGDENDLTFLQPKNVIYGLKVKTPFKNRGEKYQQYISENDFFVKTI